MFSGIFYTSVRLGERCQGRAPRFTSATMAEKLSSFPEKPITSHGPDPCACSGPGRTAPSADRVTGTVYCWQRRVVLRIMLHKRMRESSMLPSARFLMLTGCCVFIALLLTGCGDKFWNPTQASGRFRPVPAVNGTVLLGVAEQAPSRLGNGGVAKSLLM